MHYFILTVNILDFNSLSDTLLFHVLVSLKQLRHGKWTAVSAPPVEHGKSVREGSLQF